MLRRVLAILMGSWLVLEAPPVQPSPHEQPPAESSQDQIEQLQRIREGLLDPQARPIERQRWADTLLSSDYEQAPAACVELLGRSDLPDVQRALCRAIRERARRGADRLGNVYTEALIVLLGAEAEDLRALAASALADLPDPDVPGLLGALASQADAPLVNRLAAIDALSPNTHRRQVVAQLIQLLDPQEPEITDRALAALEPVVPQTFGRDLERWRTWWAGESVLSEGAWLAKQLTLYRDKWRRAEDRLRTQVDDTRRRELAFSARIHSLQREVYRGLAPEQREAKLAEWLGDALPEVNRSALAIIKARIADEGSRPSGDVLVALLALLDHGPPQIRCEVLEVVENLKDPVVVMAVLSRLEQEDDLLARRAAFNALGKQDSLLAVPAIVREIAAVDDAGACVQEAAIALGLVADQGISEEDRPAAVAALSARYATLLEDQPALRAALLSAMAGVGDSSFAPVFLSAVETDNAAVLREAIRGLRAIDDRSILPRLRTLTDHQDPMVRLEAIESVGQLGREDADLERLLTRLQPTNEPNAPAREAAWRGFLAICARRPMEQRVTLAERLREMPEYEVKYLDALAANLSATNGDATSHEVVLDRLATVLVGQERHTDAVVHLRALWDMRRQVNGDEATAAGFRLLDAMLHGDPQPQLATVIEQVAQGAGSDASKARIIELVSQHLEAYASADAADRMRALVAELRQVPPDTMGDRWTQMLDRFTAPVGDEDAPAPASPDPESNTPP